MKNQKLLTLDIQFFAEDKAQKSMSDIETEIELRDRQLEDLSKQMKDLAKKNEELSNELEDKLAKESAKKEMEDLEKQAYERAKQKRELEKKRDLQKADYLKKLENEWEERLDRTEKFFIPDGPRIGNLNRSDRELVKMIKRGGGSLEFDANAIEGARSVVAKMNDSEKNDLVNFRRSVLTTGAYGTNWDPKGMASDIISAVAALTPVSGALRQVNMPTGSFEVPTRPNSAVAGSTAEGATLTDGTVNADATANVLRDSATLTASKFSSFVDISAEESEDAIAGALPEIKRAIAEGIAEQLEEQAVSGLVGGAGVTSATAAAAGLEAPEVYVPAEMAKLGKWAVDPRELMLIVHPKYYFEKMVGNAKVLTVDTYGPRASIITGEVAKIFGMPVLVTSAPSLVIPPAGTATDTDYIALIVHRRSAVRGIRRNLTIKSDFDIKQDVFTIAGTARTAYATLHASGISRRDMSV